MRRSDRAASDIKARIIRGGQQDTACIEDIAHGGLKLAGIRTLGVGEIIVVQVDEASVSVEVIWTQTLQSGVRFLPDTCPDAVAHFRAACARQRNQLQGNAAGLRAGRGHKPLARRPKYGRSV